MPDLRFHLDQALLRLVMNLPVRVQRRLIRHPVVIDGQELSPELQLMLALQRLARIPGVEELPLDRGPARDRHGRPGWSVAGNPSARSATSSRRRRRGADPGTALHPDRASRRGPRTHAAVHPRRWLDVRRPREPRRRVPVPRRAVRRTGARDRLPALARAQVPGRRRGLPRGVPLAGRARGRGQRGRDPARRRRRLGRRCDVGRHGGVRRRERPAAGLPAPGLPGDRLRRDHREPARCSPRASS